MGDDFPNIVEWAYYETKEGHIYGPMTRLRNEPNLWRCSQTNLVYDGSGMLFGLRPPQDRREFVRRYFPAEKHEPIWLGEWEDEAEAEAEAPF